MESAAEPRRPRRPQRWDRPFDPGMGSAEVARLLAVAPFAGIDPEPFPAATPLEEILGNDARIRHYRPGDLVCVRGEYGHSAFFILSGRVRVLPGEGLDDRELGREPPRRRGWWRALGQLWRNPRYPEVRDPVADAERLTTAAGGDGETRLQLRDHRAVSLAHHTVELGVGEIFGEIAALARVPRNATVYVEEAAELVEIRWQGLRELRRWSRPFRERIDALYRERSLRSVLRESPLFAGLPEPALDRLVADTLFESYGEFEWYARFHREESLAGAERVEAEPLVAGEGHYPDGILLVSSGFARVSRRHNHGHHTVGFLRRGDLFGLEELLGDGEPRPLRYSLRALGYLDVLRVPTHLVERFIAGRAPPPAPPAAADSLGDAGLFEFLVERRYINGTATLLVDLERCTRCDDCLSACAVAHGGNPRFVRQGDNAGRFMVAAACLHCTDPVCMIGCPTGAIHRDRAGGHVLISDPLCIGCGSCAASCPFEAIRMVETRAPDGRPLVDQQGSPLLKATKCDYCREQPVAPLCERACPHDALKRVDMRDLEAVSRWLAR